MKLYEAAGTYADLWDKFDAICSYEPQTNEQGNYIDDDGNIIGDINAYRQELQRAWFDTLDGIEEEFEVKAENVAAYIKSLKAEYNAIKAEEAALNRRRRVKENQIRRMTDYLLESMKLIGRQKIDTPRAKLSIRNNTESVFFDNESEFITRCELAGADDFLRYKAPEIDRTEVKAALKRGDLIEGARLVRTQSLIIK